MRFQSFVKLYCHFMYFVFRSSSHSPGNVLIYLSVLLHCLMCSMLQFHLLLVLIHDILNYVIHLMKSYVLIWIQTWYHRMLCIMNKLSWQLVEKIDSFSFYVASMTWIHFLGKHFQRFRNSPTYLYSSSPFLSMEIFCFTETRKGFAGKTSNAILKTAPTLPW